MTVCVAVMCDGGKNVVGVSDAMMTTGNIETESQTKIISITPSSILALLGRSVFLNTDILQRVNKKFGSSDQKELVEYQYNVKDVADFYRDSFLQIRQEKIEKEILSKYGLDLETWIEKGTTISPTLVDQIIHKIEYFDFPSIEVIITGVDKSGAHIYVVNDDEVTCRDLVGYACIGAGGERAEADLLLKKYSKERPLEQAILSAFLSKKEAEVVSGVGKLTNYFFVVPEDSPWKKSGILGSGEIPLQLEKMHFQNRIRETLANCLQKYSFSNFVMTKMSGTGNKEDSPEAQKELRRKDKTVKKG